MKNKIGVASSTYPGFKIGEVLDSISKTRFKYVELASAPVYEHIVPKPEKIDAMGIDNILNMCKRYNLEIYCVAGHGRLMKKESVKNFKKVIDVAWAFGVNFVTVDTGDVLTKEDENKFYKEIREIGDYAKTKDIFVCLEPHGKWYVTGKQGAEIIKKINHPNIKLNYDTANVMYFGGVRPEDDIQYAVPYIGFMHLKDDGGDFYEWNFPALGDGNIDFNVIFNAIKDYKGPISVEIEFTGTEYTMDEIDLALKKSYDFLERFKLL